MSFCQDCCLGKLLVLRTSISFIIHFQIQFLFEGELLLQNGQKEENPAIVLLDCLHRNTYCAP